MSKLRQAAKGVDVFQMQAVDAGGVDITRTACSCTVTEGSKNVIVIDPQLFHGSGKKRV